MNKFKLGDIVVFDKNLVTDHRIVTGSSRREDLHGKIGKIIDCPKYDQEYGIEFFDYIRGHDCYEKGKAGHCYYVSGKYLELYDEEKENRKQEIRDKMRDIDPFGEEDWISESNTFKIGEKVICVRNTTKGGNRLNLTIGKIYINIGGLNNGVKVENDRGDKLYYSNYLFDKIETEEEKKKREEMKDKMRDIDPFGEEDWLSERKIPYQKTLCPDLWDGDILDERIEKKLVKIANDFFEDVEIEAEILDIHLTGSMVNYNYNSTSDIDVHVVIDFKEVNEDIELVKKAVDGQRFIWNLRHNIVIKGHDVELYIQDKSEEHTAAGLYSLLNNEWIKKPKYSRPNVDTEDVKVKYEARLYDIEKLEKISKTDLSNDEAEEYYDKSYELKSKIMKARKTGLTEDGEFSIENLVFKKLRREGKIKKLIDTISRFYDKIYSQD